MLVHQVLQDTGVKIAGTGAHGQTSQGGEAHGGVHALAAIDGGNGRTVAQVAGDQLQLFNGLAQHGSGPAGHILVRGTVETVAANLVLCVILIRKGIGIGHRGHSLMEGGIKHGHHRGVRHKSLTGLDADDVGGVVQRSQGVALLNSGHNLVGDEHALGKLLAAVNHTVTNRTDLLHGANHAVVRIHQGVEHSLDGLRMGGHSHIRFLDGLLAVGLIGELAVNANALAQALSQHLLSLGVEQLILQGRAARVDHQNIHGNRLLHNSNLNLVGLP